MSNPKNKGTKLFFSQYGGEQPIPPEFIAAMDRTEEVQPVPNDVGAETLSGTIIESKVETNRTNERVRRTVKKKAGNIVLSAIHTNDQGQPVQVTRTLYPTGTAPTQPTATTNVAVQDLGNGWSIQEVGIEGTYVANVFTPGVFASNVFERERLNLVPEEFRPTIPTVTTRVDSAGTAVDPTLSGTELSERQEQLTTFKKRITIATQAAPSLPVTLDKGRDTNQAKQDVTVIRKLISDGTAADTATALKDVQVKQLGDGNKVQETREVASVFDQDTRSIEIPDITPPWAKGLLPTTTTSSEAAATSVSTPTLSTGQIRKTVKRTTAQTVQTEITSRDAASLPKTRTNKELTREFGGGLVDIVETIASGSQTPSSGGLLVVESKMEVLGDGTSVLSTSTGEDAAWPILSDYDIDEETRQTILTTYQVVAAGTAATATVSSGVVTRYKHIDKWRSLKIVATYSTPANYDEQRFGAHNFPTLWDGDYHWSTECGAFATGFRGGFSAMVRMRVTISFSTSKATDIDGLTLIPKTLLMGRGVQLPSDLIMDSGSFVYSGTCSGTVSFGASDPDYSTYTGSIQGTEQLITGESVKMQKSGLYRTTKVYVYML